MRAALVALALLAAAPAAGQGLGATPVAGGILVENRGPAPVVALRIGERRIARLGPGEAVTVDAPPDATVAGRHDPADWAAALADLSPEAADAHLRTAGHYLDTVDPGPAGDPRAAANLRLLEAAPPDVAAAWVAPPALRLALVARAARHAPAALDPLLAAVAPDAASPAWPEAYAALPPLAEGVRRAIEAHGAAALPALDRHPAWAADRGLDPLVRAAFDPAPAPVAPPPPGALAVALDAARFDDAARLAAAAVLAGAVGDGRLVCGALDTAAAADLRAGRLIAAEGRLLLAGPWCGPTSAFRERVAALLRARGDAARGRGDLTGAVGWYRPAHWIAGADADRARLADAHGLLASLRYGEGDPAAGDRHLEAARALDALRPAVQDAIAAKPEPDRRARIALVVIIIFLGVFAARRLRRVFAPSSRARMPRADRTLKGPRGP